MIKMSMLSADTPEFHPSALSFARENQIKDVWEHNLVEEIRKISDLCEKYPLIAMDTEFPGIPFVLEDHYLEQQQYQTIKVNVDHCKIIQLGITLADDRGNYPPGTSTWQFNFKFDIDNDTHSEDSIKLLKNSGIQFERLKEKGIDFRRFAEYFIISGVCLNEDITWITFHSGYDFGYLLKYVTMEALPSTQEKFIQKINMFFPNFYDIKYMIQKFDYLRGGLNRLAEEMEVSRQGPVHQAGSDSLVTLATYIKVRDRLFSSEPVSKYKDVIFGLEEDNKDSTSYNFSNNSAPANVES